MQARFDGLVKSLKIPFSVILLEAVRLRRTVFSNAYKYPGLRFSPE